MSYPRLVFANQKPPAACDAEVIADLKLDLIFPSEVTDFLLLQPEKDTLLYRRELFSALLNDESAEEKLSSMTDALEASEMLYKALISAQSEKTAAIVFVRLFVRVADFLERSAQLSAYGYLAQRFSGEMENILTSPDFKAARERTAELIKNLDSVNRLALKTDSENATVQKFAENGIADALRACASELEIEISEKPVTPFAMQKELADSLAQLFPDECAKATEFLTSNRALITGELFDYIPELKFLTETLRFTKRATASGLPYCFPELVESKRIELKNVYDVTLLKKEGTSIVPNDVNFTENEPFFYLTGANGGGKTTYIRTVGGAMLLFLAGAPVFCEGGSASLLSAVFTHFPRDERFEGTGRFLDEKNRVHAMLEKLDGNALVLLNETFATTGEEKAIEQTGILADTLYSSGNFGLYITHQHGLSKTDIPFLGVTVDENDRNRRTYKIEKRRLPPKSFAKDILEKYGLDKESLVSRFMQTNAPATQNSEEA